MVNQVTRAPLPDVAVTILDVGGQPRGTVLTDSAGAFRMPLPTPGRYQLRAQHQAYATSTSTVMLLVREPSLRYFYGAENPEVGVPIVLERRGGQCFPMLYIDAMPIGRTNRTALRTMVAIDEIEGIEIYRSAIEIPGEFRDDCGVIAVWTHRAVVGEGLGNPFTVRRVAIAASFLTLMTLQR